MKLRICVFAAASAALVGARSPARAAPTQADDLAGPPLEVASGEPAVTLPAIPAFVVPPPDGARHHPRELRVHGKRALGSELQVAGYVTAIYDCVAALAATNPKATRAQIVASIDKTPSLCESPKFYLGDAKDTPREASIWVADVPRAPTQAERQQLSRAELAARPAVPRLTAGDYVIVTGTWDVQSPGHDHSPDGLLIYKALDHAAPPAPTIAVGDQPAPPAPEIAVVTQPPPRTAVDAAARTASIAELTTCNKAFAARQYDAAVAACDRATARWPGNHMAWYIGASAHMARDEWPAAQAATGRAVALRPDQAMYQLYDGVARYEAEHARVRGELAQRDHVPLDQVSDPATVRPALLQLDAARDALLRAARLAPALWRAHFYLARVYRDLDDAPREAAQLAQTVATHAAYRFAYVALAELYRRWDFHDQAIAVAQLGIDHVPAAEAPELAVEIGMAKFQRGQLAFHRGDLAAARRDLDDVVATTDPRLAGVRPTAAQLLAQIARKH